MRRTLFADISSNNDSPNLGMYAKAGHRLVAIKATEGQTYNNGGHAREAHRAHDLGLVVAHYHFCRPGAVHDVSAEMRHFWRAVVPVFEPGDLLVLDFEVNQDGQWPSDAAYVAACDRALTSHAGIAPILYCPLGFTHNLVPALRISSRNFWVAAYPGPVRRLGLHRHRWAHQFTDGLVGGKPRSMAGIGRCDVSRLTPWGLADLTVRRARRRRAGLKVAR